MHLQDAVKKEAARVAIATGIGTLIMLLVFFLLHIAHIFGDVPFGIAEIVSAAVGWFVASMNFFLMAVTVQKVAGLTDDQDRAKKTMTASYRYRMIFQLVWAVLSFAVKFFNPAAAIIPLFIPSIAIKISGIRAGKKGTDASSRETGNHQNPNGEVSASR